MGPGSGKNLGPGSGKGLGPGSGKGSGIGPGSGRATGSGKGKGLGSGIGMETHAEYSHSHSQSHRYVRYSTVSNTVFAISVLDIASSIVYNAYSVRKSNKNMYNMI